MRVASDSQMLRDDVICFKTKFAHMAEVVVNKGLFAEILSRIERLRCCPA